MTLTRRLLACGLLLGASVCAWPATFGGVVTHVGDGDTVWVRPDGGGAPRPVRLEGIDAPEICQAYGAQARDALAARVLRRQVRVEGRAQDAFDRTVGTVSLGGEDLGGWMVRRGHAWSYRFRGHPGPFAAQEKLARREGLGLWNARLPESPRDFRKRHGRCH